MTRFRTRFQRVAVPNLLREFGEEIGYFNAAGDPVRTITAMIEREVDLMTEAGDVSAQATIVRVENDATVGITSTEIDTGGDEISYPLRVGEDAVRRAIIKGMSTENGLVRFMVQ